MKHECIIIGGGAAGLMLAAMTKTNNGIVLEGTAALGTKLLMTGGGHCNLTHAGSIKDFVDCYDEAGRALRKCLYRHSNIEMLKWLDSIGVPTIELEDRYYPATERAIDVRDALVRAARNNGWQFKLNEKVSNAGQSFLDNGPKGTGLAEGWHIVTSQNEYDAARVVIATGGITYPETGSDGSLFPVIRDLGIEVTELKSALAPVYVRDYPYVELSGVSIPNVTVTAFSSDVVNTCKGKSARITGDLLFTHTGFSGPAILKISKYCEPGEKIRIDYNIGKTGPDGQTKTYESLPKRFRKTLEDRARGESGDIKTSKLAGLLESDEFIVKSIDVHGIVTSGGISLSEIDSGTMEIKKCPGLFAIGEAIDADGTTGGYNLQLCYSTAATASEQINQ